MFRVSPHWREFGRAARACARVWKLDKMAPLLNGIGCPVGVSGGLRCTPAKRLGHEQAKAWKKRSFDPPDKPAGVKMWSKSPSGNTDSCSACL